MTEDRQLVDAVLAGDSEAFRVLIERESKPLIRVCSRILRDPVEAEDAAQDAFLQAYRALATFRGDGPFGAWVTRIAVRVASARLMARKDVVTLDGRDAEMWASTLGSGDDPEASALDQERRLAIRDAVTALPLSQREVIALRFYGDLTLQEIAQVTNHPVGTVKSRLHRGMASLRDLLRTRST